MEEFKKEDVEKNIETIEDEFGCQIQILSECIIEDLYSNGTPIENIIEKIKMLFLEAKIPFIEATVFLLYCEVISCFAGDYFRKRNAIFKQKIRELNLPLKKAS